MAMATIHRSLEIDVDNVQREMKKKSPLTVALIAAGGTVSCVAIGLWLLSLRASESTEVLLQQGRQVHRVH